MPYRRAAEMLGELLPISDGAVSHATLRRRALAVGARLDAVPASARLVVAIDGTYVRSNGEQKIAAFVRQRLPNVRHQMWNGQFRAESPVRQRSPE